ncbi:hypothetical protein [Nocardia sp. NPDC019395]|uniref:hypothetical protein n=1 Tax=Nocardia sp. NPDC019395 TaxID=3154686 RepID=UPI003401AB2B
MPLPRRCFPALLVAGLLAAGCAAADPEQTDTGVSAGVTDTAQSVALAVRIAGGSVTPVDTRLDARVGQPIELTVDSDTDDELHVHSHPDHIFPVVAGESQRFQFTVDIPGRVDIELHHTGITVATVLVRE